MPYAERSVAPDIEVWTSDGPSAEHRILPDGCLDLIHDGEHLLVAGPDTAARLHCRDDADEMTGVRLHAGLGPALLGVPADELTDRTIPLADLWGARRAGSLADRVASRPATALARWAISLEASPFGARLHALLASGRSVGEAASALGYSARQLQRLARPAFGYGPQHLGRVLRLQRTLAPADRGLDWATIALRAGYADQAHLVREVRALAGVTPTALHAERVRSIQDDREPTP